MTHPDRYQPLTPPEREHSGVAVAVVALAGFILFVVAGIVLSVLFGFIDINVVWQ